MDIQRLLWKGVAWIMAGFCFGCSGEMSYADVRKPAIAGTWYPDRMDKLGTDIDHYLQEAPHPELPGEIVGVVVPHAGYQYSGIVAASAYQAIRGKSYDVVVLIGCAHRVGFQGAALDAVDAYHTPFGDVPVDTEFINRIAALPFYVVKNRRPHDPEHSLEAQIPFLQRVLKPGFKIVPILFGREPGTAYKYLVENIPLLLKGKTALIIASTDLTHFPNYDDSCRIDQRTVEIIASMDQSGLDRIEREEMKKFVPSLDCVLCAPEATKAVIELSRSLGADKGIVMHRANSGDAVIGDKHRVVGYGAVAFCRSNSHSQSTTQTEEKHSEESMMGDRLTIDQEKYLLGLSRYVLASYVKTGKTPSITSPDNILDKKRGAFVTLKMHGELRGCIGTIMPVDPCYKTVISNTINACSQDPRFRPVTSAELDQIDIEISVLSTPLPVSSYREIIIGKHGIVLKKGHNKSVFLPQVAPEQGWTLEETLRHLALKAGLSADGWKSGASFDVFEAQVFGELERGRQPFPVQPN